MHTCLITHTQTCIQCSTNPHRQPCLCTTVVHEVRRQRAVGDKVKGEHAPLLMSDLGVARPLFLFALLRSPDINPASARCYRSQITSQIAATLSPHCQSVFSSHLFLLSILQTCFCHCASETNLPIGRDSSFVSVTTTVGHFLNKDGDLKKDHF